jgi:hypothetical protein
MTLAHRIVTAQITRVTVAAPTQHGMRQAVRLTLVVLTRVTIRVRTPARPATRRATADPLIRDTVLPRRNTSAVKGSRR